MKLQRKAELGKRVLVVPILCNAEHMNIAEVEKKINNLDKKANDGTISIDVMAGETFSISSGGVSGSLLSTPIINPLQYFRDALNS